MPVIRMANDVEFFVRPEKKEQQNFANFWFRNFKFEDFAIDI